MILQARELSKTYSQGDTAVPVLRGVDFAVAEGETVAVVGQSGSGKSTLLSLLAGLDRPSGGEIVVGGQALNRLDEAGLAAFRGSNIGIVFQQFHLMSTLTALENVALPLEIAGDPDADAKAAEALRLVGLEHRARHLPHQMSGGECQRVAIARAFVTSPKILLADEPSGNLDTRTGNQVMQLLFDRVKASGMTMVLVTHNEALAAECGRRAILEDGRIR